MHILAVKVVQALANVPRDMSIFHQVKIVSSVVSMPNRIEVRTRINQGSVEGSTDKVRLSRHVMPILSSDHILQIPRKLQN